MKNSNGNKNLVLSCIKVDFTCFNIDSNIANGVVPAVVKYYEKNSISLSMLTNHQENSYQYLPVNNILYISLKSIMEHPYSEQNKRQIMLNVGQILFRNNYFFKKYTPPDIIYVYNISECEKAMKECFGNNANKYLKQFPKPISIERKYSFDEKTVAKLDKIVNYLFEASLNMAIFNLFDDYNALNSGKSAFGLLHKSLLEKQKAAAKYNPSAKFMNNLKMLADEHTKTLNFFKKSEKITGYCFKEILYYLKKTEFFLLLSENFGYQIPQNLKNAFKTKINTLISIMKSVFSDYSNINLEFALYAINNMQESINKIAENICSTPANETTEYRGYFSKANALQDFIADSPTLSIGYNYLADDYTSVVSYRVKKLLERLRPFIQNKDSIKYNLFSINAVHDPDFPLFDNGTYITDPESILCYMNVAKILNQIVDSQYPYEFIIQKLITELPEIMPFISSAFCDCNILLK